MAHGVKAGERGRNTKGKAEYHKMIIHHLMIFRLTA